MASMVLVNIVYAVMATKVCWLEAGKDLPWGRKLLMGASLIWLCAIFIAVFPTQALLAERPETFAYAEHWRGDWGQRPRILKYRQLCIYWNGD